MNIADAYAWPCSEGALVIKNVRGKNNRRLFMSILSEESPDVKEKEKIRRIIEIFEEKAVPTYFKKGNFQKSVMRIVRNNTDKKITIFLASEKGETYYIGGNSILYCFHRFFDENIVDRIPTGFTKYEAGCIVIIYKGYYEPCNPEIDCLNILDVKGAYSLRKRVGEIFAHTGRGMVACKFGEPFEGENNEGFKDSI